MCVSKPNIPDPIPPAPPPPPPAAPTAVQPPSATDKSLQAKKSGTGSLRIDRSQANAGAGGSGLNIPM
jgi:hypothetical protein